MTTHTFYLPDLGEGLTHARICDIHIQAGQCIQKDETVLTVETDKSLVDIPAIDDGQVINVLCQVDDHVKVGQGLFTITTDQPLVGRIPDAPSNQPNNTSAPDYKIHPNAKKLANEMQLSEAYLSQLAPGKIITTEMISRQTTHTMNMISQQSQNRPTSVLIDHAIIPSHQKITPLLISALIKTMQEHLSFSLATPKETPLLGLACDDESSTHILTLNWSESPTENATLLSELKTCMQSGKFPQEWKKQPDILLSNFGSIAGRYGIPLLYLNSNVSLGIGQAFTENDQKTLPITLVFDHAKKTGGQAAYFLKTLKKNLKGTYS